MKATKTQIKCSGVIVKSHEKKAIFVENVYLLYAIMGKPHTPCISKVFAKHKTREIINQQKKVLFIE